MKKADPEKLYTLGYTYYERGDYPRAIAFFTELATQEPLDERSWRALASARQMAGQYQEAIYAWGFSAMLGSDDPAPHFHAAECLLSMGQKEDALKALDAADKRCSGESEFKQRIAALR